MLAIVLVVAWWVYSGDCGYGGGDVESVVVVVVLVVVMVSL